MLRRSPGGRREAHNRARQWVTSIASPSVEWRRGRHMCWRSTWPHTTHPDKKWDVQKDPTS